VFVGGESSGHRERQLADFNLERMHALFRDVQVVTLPGLGHMMHHEDPQAVADPIINFVGAQP
jgi:pimeloyl-ACP methyl ester carboxylesterase